MLSGGTVQLGRTFGNAAKCLADVAAAAHERNVEVCLVNVVLIVGGCQHFTLIDVVDPDCLKDLRLYEVSDADFSHDRDGDSSLDLLDHLRIAHASNAAVLKRRK